MGMKQLVDRAPGVKGHLVAEAHDADGRLVSRWEGDNAYTVLAAMDYAKALAGEAVSLPITEIGLGSCGWPLDYCEATTGWTGSSATVAADTGIYVQGGASIKVTVNASTTGTASHPDIYAGSMDATGDWIELSLRVDYGGRLAKASSWLRVYTGAGTGTYWRISWTDVEAIAGTLADGVWKKNIRIPVASFSVGAGSPTWTDVRGVGIVLAVGAAGAVNVWIDDWRVYQTPDLTSAATTLPGEQVRQAVTTLSRNTRTVTAVAFWTMSEAVGTFYVAGLWSSTTLISILAFDYAKDQNLTLTLTWTITTQGA